MAEENATSIRDISSQFQNFFQTLSVARRLILLSIVSIVLLGLVALIVVTNQETWVPLYSNISNEDAAIIKEKLDQNQIPVQIGPGGRSILVRSDLADEARLALARERISLGGGLGFADLFLDSSGIGETEFNQNVKFRMALEGEIARMIMKINSVRFAKVTLALPKKSLFITKEEKPKASIIIDLGPGQTLGRKQVVTIAHLAANSVERLVIKNVVVVDQAGRLLSKGISDEDQGGSFQDQFSFKRKIERSLESKIINQLEPIVGPNRVKPSVDVVLSFDRVTTREEIFDPDGTVVRSERVSTENAVGTRSIPVGIPGVASNLPETRAGASEVANVSKLNKTNQVRNYETSVKRVVSEPSIGKIQRVSVSVLIDGKYTPTADPDTGEILDPKWEFWTTEEMKDIEKMIKAAVGFNAKRGDTLIVTNMRFEAGRVRDLTGQIEKKERDRQFFTDIIRYTFLGVLLLAMIMFVVRPMVQRLSQKPEDLDLLMGLPATIGELEGEELEIPTEREVGLPPREKIIEIARADPLATASLVRAWLREKR
ncbi:MAG: flagellar M-ring protein FliF [SAR324 cluster bacterium]|nr:flagellar M-ring protein FliF [SAR324 cluster bacterium]